MDNNQLVEVNESGEKLKEMESTYNSIMQKYIKKLKLLIGFVDGVKALIDFSDHLVLNVEIARLFGALGLLIELVMFYTHFMGRHESGNFL